MKSLIYLEVSGGGDECAGNKSKISKEIAITASHCISIITQ